MTTAFTRRGLRAHTEPLRVVKELVVPECQGCGSEDVPVSVVAFGQAAFTLCQSCLIRFSARIADAADPPSEPAP